MTRYDSVSRGGATRSRNYFVAMAAAVILTLMTMGLSTMGDGSLYRERCDECPRFPCALSGVL